MSAFDTPIKLSKHEARVIRWLHTATSTDNQRPALKGIKVDDELIATNGYRIHLTDAGEVPPLAESEGKVMAFSTVPPNSECYVGVQEAVGEFPDHVGVIKQARSNEALLEIGVNPKFLIEALRNLDTHACVKLVFYTPSEAFEVHGTITTGEKETKVYAMIMPRHLGD